MNDILLNWRKISKRIPEEDFGRTVPTKEEMKKISSLSRQEGQAYCFAHAIFWAKDTDILTTSTGDILRRSRGTEN